MRQNTGRIRRDRKGIEGSGIIPESGRFNLQRPCPFCKFQSVLGAYTGQIDAARCAEILTAMRMVRAQ